MDIQKIINTLQYHIVCLEADIKRKTQARWKRIEEAFVDGDVIPPTQDANGRLHAPCDGYLLPSFLVDMCDMDYSDRKFGAGEYLPVPFGNDDVIFFSNKPVEFKYTCKLRITRETYEILEALKTRYMSIDHGKFWESNGVEYCNLYMRADYKVFFEKVRKVIQYISDYEKRLEQARKGAAPEGRTKVEGVIVGLPIQESPYGFNNFDFRMMVQLNNGATVYGTLPSSICSAKIGDRVSFAATFTPSDDTTHAYFKRPSGAQIVNQETTNETN